MKVMTTITLDSELVLEMRMRRENVSGTLNRLLKSYLDIKGKESIKESDLTIELEKKRIELNELQLQKQIMESEKMSKEKEAKSKIVASGDD